MTTTLREVAATQYGLSEAMNDGVEGFKIFRMGEVQGGRLIDTGRMKRAAISAVEFQKYALRKGDVLFNRTNSFELVGKTGIFDLEGDYCFASYLVRLTVDRDRLLPEFLNYFMNSAAFQTSVKAKASKSVNQANINATILGNESICIPESLSEQRRIVDILDEAFAAITTAKANAEKNLQNARELFESYLHTIFESGGPCWISAPVDQHIQFIDYRGRTPDKKSDGLRLITAKNVKKGFIQKEPMEFVAPESYEAWMTRGIPKIGDVLFTTEAPLGNVAQLDTSEQVVFAQRVIIMQADPLVLDSTFLKYLLLSGPVQAKIHSNATGATALGIKASLLKRIEITFPTSLSEQTAIVGRLDELAEKSSRLEAVYRRKIEALDELKKLLMHQAFTGQLTKNTALAIQVPYPQTATPECTANVIALAYVRHAKQHRERTFGRVKEQKVLHLVESIAKVDLGRQPMKDAAGPNDFQHMLKAELWAKEHSFFEMVDRGQGYDFKPLKDFDKYLSNARKELGPHLNRIEEVIDLLVPMDSQDAEVFATVHAAWNNLLMDGVEATESAILKEARDTWHPDKLSIPEHKFKKAIELVRRKNLIPDGTGKYVTGQRALL